MNYFHPSFEQLAQQIILDRFTLPCVLVNEREEILYIQGKLGKFLEFSTGVPSQKIIELARGGIKLALSHAFRQAKQKNADVQERFVRFEANGETLLVHLNITPVEPSDFRERLFLVTFEEGTREAEQDDWPDAVDYERRIQQLEGELETKEQELRLTIRQLKLSNDALLRAYEESNSLNEEFQSINEELESSKEELVDTNRELREKIQQIGHFNDVLTNLLSSTDIATLFLDRELKIFEFTPAVAPIVALERTDIGRSIRLFSSTLQGVDWVEEATVVLEHLQSVEHEVETADSQTYWMRILPYRTAVNEVQGVVITFTDITKSKARANELAKYQQRLEQMVEERTGALQKNEAMLARTEKFARIGSWEWEIESDTVTWSAELYHLLDLDPALGAPSYAEHDKIFEPDELARLQKVVERAVTQAEPYAIELTAKAGDGEKRFIVAHGFPEQDENGRVVKLVGSYQDITERKSSENALLLANKQMELAVKTARIGIWNLDLNDGTILWNDELSAIYGITGEQFEQIVEGWQNCIYPEDLSIVDAEYQKIAEGKVVENIRFRIRTTDGQTKHIYASGAPIYDEKGNLSKLIGINIDVSHIVEFERALQESEEQMLNITNNLPGAVLTYRLAHDGQEEILFLSQGAEKVWEIPSEEVLADVGKLWARVFTEDVAATWAALQYSVKSLTDFNHEWRIEMPSGKIKWLNGRGIPKRMVDGSVVWHMLILDITLRKEAEAKEARLAHNLQQSQKMAAMGRLAGGIAHDFNNLLVPILGYAELGERRMGDEAKLASYFEKIYAAAARGRSLTNQILAFSRKQVLHMQVVDLNEVLQNFLEMSQRLIGEHISLGVELTPEPYLVKADSSQIEQVLLNLIVNARDAMPDGGRLTIRSENLVLEETAVLTPPATVSEGEYLCLSITDTGHGVDKELLDKIFEPFFTTKERSKGTGLGLATVSGIILQHNGFIDLQSEVGKGSTFRIFLPKAADELPSKATPVKPLPVLTGGETILVVEDDGLVRTLVLETLEEYGYTVLEAATPKSALELVSEYPDVIHLLITDMIMPEMNGLQLQQLLLEQLPHLKTLFISGYVENKIVQEAILADEVNFLQKPFGVEQLLALMRQLLEVAE